MYHGFRDEQAAFHAPRQRARIGVALVRQMNGPEQLVRNPLVLRHAVQPRLILERLIGREEGIEDDFLRHDADRIFGVARIRSEEHTSELQSLMRISYAV